MKRMYTPWRHDYVSKTTRSGDKEKLKNDCVFCQSLVDNNDEENLVLKRFKHCFVILNYYPYNSGHLMILPNEHKPELSDLDQETRAEIMEVTNICVEVLKKVLSPGGFNIGINLGLAGGGGLPSHLHVHILPRWEGDTNFFATVGEVKMICSDFYKIYDELKGEFESLDTILLAQNHSR